MEPKPVSVKKREDGKECGCLSLVLPVAISGSSSRTLLAPRSTPLWTGVLVEPLTGPFCSVPVPARETSMKACQQLGEEPGVEDERTCP